MVPARPNACYLFAIVARSATGSGEQDVKRVSLYSSSDRTRKDGSGQGTQVPDDAADAPPGSAGQVGGSVGGTRWRRFITRHERALLLGAGAMLALLIVLVHASLTRQPRPITQEDIDAAVLHSLETTPPPSRSAKAYEAVRRSVVRVHGTGYRKEQEGRAMEGIGSGVVIVDSGIILTNLHVVAGAERITVEFEDGFESRQPSSARGRSTTSPCSRLTRFRTTFPPQRCARHPTWP